MREKSWQGGDDYQGFPLRVGFLHRRRHRRGVVRGEVAAMPEPRKPVLGELDAGLVDFPRKRRQGLAVGVLQDRRRRPNAVEEGQEDVVDLPPPAFHGRPDSDGLSPTVGYLAPGV